jgi:hypothetical protein
LPVVAFWSGQISAVKEKVNALGKPVGKLIYAGQYSSKL